jgi:hypothetical protein
MVYITERHDILAVQVPQIGTAHSAHSYSGNIQFVARGDVTQSAYHMAGDDG